jgi:hypothetical protein
MVSGLGFRKRPFGKTSNEIALDLIRVAPISNLGRDMQLLRRSREL